MISSMIFGNGTDIVHWKASPTTRGTFDILTICLTTLVLCVWTAVHLNVAPPESTWASRVERKVGWLVLTLIAPEMVAYTAWEQRSEAKEIMHTMNKARGLPNPSSWLQSSLRGTAKVLKWLNTFVLPQQRKILKQPTLEAQRLEGRRAWTMVHGFYAAMGGFAFQCPSNLPESERFLPTDDKEIWFLNGDAVTFLIQLYGQDSTPFDVSEEDIRSKSKANGLAKTLVCIQALWFIAQCLTRLIAHTSISLLELNTFGHAICALLIYFLWWEKPFEVDYPSFVQDQNVRDLFAAFCMHNRSLTAELVKQELSTYIQSNPDISAKWKEKSKNFGVAERDLLKILHDPRTITTTNHDVELEEHVPENHGNVEDGVVVLQPGQTLLDTGWKVASPSEVTMSFPQFMDVPARQTLRVISSKVNDTSSDTSLRYNLRLDSRAVNRWKMAWRMQVAGGALYHPVRSQGRLQKCFGRRIRDWPDMNNFFDTVGISFGFCAAAFVYGGLHALAWSAHFESPAQKVLWQISSSVVMGGLPVIFILVELGDASLPWLPDRINDIKDRIFLSLICLIFIAYVLARAYLVVECFIQLFNLPAGVFDVPQWTAYFPHIS